MSKHTTKEIRRTPSLFASTFLKILDKDMNIIPFVYNELQADYISKRTARDIILKPRQIGFSTLIQGELFRYVTTRTARVTTIGKDNGNTSDLRAIFNRYFDNLPEGHGLNRSISNATETAFPDFDSRAIIAKAGNTSSGRGGTNYAVHLSEVAFYRDAQSIVQGITQAGNPKWIVLESTANGQSNYFYDLVMQTYTSPDSTAWSLHFYRWFDFPQYRLDLPPNYDINAHKPDDNEKQLIADYGVGLDQLLWRRAKISEIGLTAFEVEYPHTVENAFKGTGNSAFYLEHSHIRDTAPTFDPDAMYVAGVDWGRENDYTALSIFDVHTGHEVYIDKWRKPLSYSQIRAEIARVLCEWRVKLCVCEYNSIGGVNMHELSEDVMVRWRGLGNELHTAPGIDRFVTTNKTKAYAVDLFRRGLESHDILLMDNPDANAELRAYQETLSPSGTPQWSAPSSGHDDTVMARLIAWVAVMRSYRKKEGE